MIGNQILINNQILIHKDNPIDAPIGNKKEKDIIYTITDEYWKQWKKDLMHSEAPAINMYGLGIFELMYGKSRTYMRKQIGRMRNIERKDPEKYTNPETRAYGLYESAKKSLHIVWKQVDNIKHRVNNNILKWKTKKALREQNNINNE